MLDGEIHIGDVLQVREWDEMLEDGVLDAGGDIRIEADGIKQCFPKCMRYMCGKQFTVKKILDGGRAFLYTAYENETHGAYAAYAAMLKPIDEEELDVFDDEQIKLLLEGDFS